ncbi:MAG: DEAD/DEAH box helicase [Actinomycetota bacterium]|nr:DEAD/DEAH box helicase [Actinomycetota bacterium]
MERALDRERLRAALGSPQGLPTPEELGDLLARVEVGLFLRRPSLPEELLAAGWYLHGVASADAANDLYPYERRRAAWQVSAHVFDLALESEQETLHERLRYGFAAQVGYLKGEAPPNAMSIHRRVAPLIGPPDVRGSIDVVGLILGVTFLQFDWRQLRSTLQHVEDQLRGIARESAIGTFNGTPYGPLDSLARGCRALMRYLNTGDAALLDEADAGLYAAVLAEGAERYLDIRWVAAHLRTLTTDLRATSIWEVLPPDVPTGVKRAFTSGRPSVNMLWPPQIEAVREEHGVSALSPTVRRIVLSVPTSSGKTLISQLFTLCHLAAGRGGVCYVVPTRSLAREVRRDVSRRLRFFAGDVIPEQYEWAPLARLDARGDVEVLTPERLAHLIRTDVAGLLERFGMFVFDEAHSVGEGDRGFTVESCVALLHWLTKKTDHRLILMSASLGNRMQIRSWVDPDGAGRAAESDWRGPRRLHAIYNTDIDWSEPAKFVPTKSDAWPKCEIRPMLGRIRLRPTRTGRVVNLRTTEPVGVWAVRQNARGERETDRNTQKIKKDRRATPAYKTLTGLIELVGDAGPVLVVRSTRQKTRELAQALAAELEDDPATTALAELAAGRVGPDHPLAAVLRRGVAYHHAGLPTDVLDAIEDAVREGRLRYIIATTSLTDGVNLPVRTVIIDEPTGDYARPLSPAQTINAVGRAGRACLESEGWAILVRQAPPRVSDFDRLDPSLSDLEVRSSLVQQEALDALAEFEELQRTTHDAAFAVAGNRVSDFISFVWLVLTASEELGAAEFSSALEEALPATLAWQQLGPETQQRWRDLAVAVAAAYERSDPVRRRRWGRIATSLGSARTLDRVTDTIVESASGSTADLSDPWACIELLDTEGVIEDLFALPEAGDLPAVFSARTGRNRHEIRIEHVDLLRRWMQGTEINDIADEFLSDVAAPDFRYEQLGDYLTGRFEHYLAWVVSAVVEWANRRLSERGEEHRLLCPDLGGFVRYGTGSPLALGLMQQGVRSRRLANVVAEQAHRQGVTDADDLQDWLRALGLRRWAQSFDASPIDLRDLLDVVRDRDVRLLGAILGGETASMTLDPSGTFDDGEVSFEADDSGALFVVEEGQRIADIPARHHADLAALLETGLPFTAWLEQQGGGSQLLIRLSDD